MAKAFLTKEHISISGGVNNLQVVRIVSNSPHSRLMSIHNTFTSKVGKAEAYARKWAKNNEISLNN